VPQLPLGLLRRVEEPVGPLVLDVPLRQPAENEGLPQAQTLRLGS
jgi:hypothetical protein